MYKIKNKVKKNINIFKKDKFIKIKSSIQPIKKSMIDALKLNEVNLWGFNSIDSILLGLYEKNKKTNNNMYINDIYDNYINNKNNEIKTLDTEFNPNNHYNICDLDFLNNEYNSIENKINKLDDSSEEYEYLLEVQDNLCDIINTLESKLKYERINTGIKTINLSKNNNNNNKENEDIIIELEIEPKKSVKSEKKTNIKIKKLKPYYYIDKVPDGYRESTEEEAILNKKVSLYGKKKINRELNTLFEITGTIYMNITDLTELNNQLALLKGKLRYYKKEIDYYKISLESDSITFEYSIKIKEKIKEMKNNYKKTLDIYNLFLKQYNKIINKDKNNK